MIKSLFTFLFLLGTVSYIAQGFPKKISKQHWNQNNDRRGMHLSSGHMLQERSGSRLTVRADEDCKCGRKNEDRIVGGEDASPGEWCWQVKLNIYPSVDDGTYELCGGSIINDRYVLSAAHCFYGKDDYTTYIALGAYKGDYDEDEVSYDGESIVMHPDYDPRSKANDFALIKLADTIEYTPSICSVCLPTSEVEDDAPVTVTGWGTLESGGDYPDVLQEVKVYIVPKSECEDAYGALDDSQLCAADDGKDACQGDSGGPLVHEGDDGVWSLVGVVSGGIGCADPKYPGLYSDVFKMMQWIMDNTEGGNYCSAE